MPEYDMPIEEQIQLLVREFQTFKTTMASFETKLTTVDRKIDKVQVLLEETHAIGKLGLEGLEGLRESTEERFASAAKTNAEQIGLLKSVVVHVRTRVEQKGRRRS